MPLYDYDLLVIGAGSGGVAASRRAASYGGKVAICEADRVGGTCVIRGCVPKKLLVYASQYAESFRDAEGYGWAIPQPPIFDWPTLIHNKDKEIERLSVMYQQMLDKAGVTLLQGYARFIDAHTITLQDRNITAKYILIATGGVPIRPLVPGIEHAITSDEAFQLTTLPRSIAIVGGGYIALEFASIFHGLGSHVTLLHRGEKILRGFDGDIRNHLTVEMEKKGMTLCPNTHVTRIAKEKDHYTVALTHGPALAVECVMFATGRKPNTRGLNLEAVDIIPGEDGSIPVNAGSQTATASIYAVGDVTNRINLTPIAINEGRAFADTVFGQQPRSIDHRNIPSAVFCHPEVATVGLGEEAARDMYEQLDIYKTSFRPMKYALTGNAGRMFMKLVVDARTSRVVGAHMVGENAAEIIQGIAVAIQCGATKAQFDATIAIHPSAAEEFVTMRERSGG